MELLLKVFSDFLNWCQNSYNYYKNLIESYWFRIKAFFYGIRVGRGSHDLTVALLDIVTV